MRTILEKFFPKKIDVAGRLAEIDQHYSDWLSQGKPLPNPHRLKQQIIQFYQQQYGCTTLVETGTYFGDMVHAQLPYFQKIYSIELQPVLHYRTKRRFKNEKKVVLLQGDSGKVLFKLVPTISEPALYWLDGHYSMGITAKGDKECPILEELDAIFTLSQQPPIILIDDARLFIGENDYPTLEALRAHVNRYPQGYSMDVAEDVIRLTPRIV